MSTKDEQIVKVEGWVHPNAGEDPSYTVDVAPELRAPFTRPALLLIAPEGSTQVPRYFSEGEVRAMLKEAEEQVANMTYGKVIPVFRSIAMKYKFTL